MMKVLVPIKRVVDPYVKIRVRTDNSGVETQHVKMVINPFDEIAIEEAVRWKEAGLVTEIVVASIGPQAAQETLRAALALGADSALHILCDKPLEPLAIAKCLSVLVKQQNPDLVIMGKQAIDDDCNQTGQMLAALLNWPQATFASKIAFSAEKKMVDVTREVDGGLETLTVKLPCVITTDLRLNEPRYASLPNIMQAKRKPLTTQEIASLDVDITPRLTVVEVAPPKARKAGKMVKDVAELVHYLKDVEKVI
jgi:electron transfer flavoprotein beta subunit